MNKRVEHLQDSRAEPHKTPKPITINDFLLTYMLLSPKPVVAVSKAITGAKLPVRDAQKAVECYVLGIPWQRDC